MHTIDGLILDGGRPPRVSEHDLVSRYKIKPNAADGKASEYDGAVWIGLKGSHGRIALRGAHGAVNPDKGVILCSQLGLDDVEEGGPLAEYDGFGVWFAVGGSEDAEEGFDFTAAGFNVDLGLTAGFSKSGGWANEAFNFERLGATHGAAVLGVDDTLNAFIPEHMGTRSDHRVVQILEANWAIFARIDVQL